MSKNTTPKKTIGGFGKPGAFAQTRREVGGDWAAAVLFYRLKFRWLHTKKKLNRKGKDWVAMSRADWAREAGLSEGEMKNRALPNLRKCSFVEIRPMRLSPNHPRMLWMRMDWDDFEKAIEPLDIYEKKLNGGKIIGYKKPPAYPYNQEHDPDEE